MRLRRGEGLNLVPFIDIVLVLLAIILSVSTFIAQGQIPVEIPKASASQTPRNEKKMSLVIDRQNRLFVDGKEMDLKSLNQIIDQVSPQTLIELKSDKESKFESFIQVLNILKEHQHENFAISTQKD